MSILNDVKEDINAPPGDDFDSTILRYINSACMQLAQIGATNNNIVTVTANSEWTDFIVKPQIKAPVQDLVSTLVRLKFDPPASDALVQVYNREIEELEWRIITQLETVIQNE